MTEKDKKEFAFMSEQVRKKPFYRKKGFLRGCQAAALAVIFGGVAGATFAVVKPLADKQFGDPVDEQKIVIIPDETEEVVATEPVTEPPTEKVTETEEPVPQTIVEQKELEISDYKQLYSKMAAVGEEAAKSVVTVTGESSNVDFFEEVIENQVQASGMVIEMNQQDVFVLTDKRTIEGAQRIIVTFRDGTTADAILQKQDGVSGLAVIKVSLSELSEETKLSIQKPNLSKTAAGQQGAPVIAIGTPMVNSNSIAFGMITSSVNISTVDEEYRVLTTDIIGSNQGSGVLVDLDGRVIGIIAQDLGGEGEQITITALAISDIKGLIQALANNEDWTYMGIIGREISESVAQDLDMPQGIYIKEIASDSPAMHAGIYGGTDILVSIDGKEIRTMKEYVEELQKHAPETTVTIGLKRGTLDGYVDLEVPVTLGKG